MDTTALLDAAVKRFGSDSAVARHLGISRQAISNARHGRDNLSDYNAARLAEAAGQRWELFLALKAEKAESLEEGKYWLGKLKALLKTAALCVLLAIIPAKESPAIGNSAGSEHQPGIYNAHISRDRYRNSVQRGDVAKAA